LGDIFSRIEHSRTADEVIDQIETLILEGVLSAGDRLPGERELARQFDVSRPILRDALKSLEARGLLVTRHGGGTHVADIIGEVFSKPVMDLIASQPKAAHDYLEYRREIEGIAAEYAARRATADDLALLDGIMARMDEAYRTGDFEDEAGIDVEFHHAVGECAHNIILLHTLRSCYRLLSEGVFQNRLLIFSLPGAREELLKQHRAIHAAVKAGDPAGARKAAMDHIAYVERSMAEAVRSDDWQRVSRLRLRQRAGDVSSLETGHLRKRDLNERGPAPEAGPASKTNSISKTGKTRP
jgi:GntR family transcriptional repressor for pyruvate dehydrogenase complex